MSKTLENLITKAELKGFAKLNGRMRSYGYTGAIEEKYSIEVIGSIVTLNHWGTETLKIDTTSLEVLNVYGQSVSDRDSVNYVLSYYGIPCHVHYFPSREEFELHQDVTEEILKTV